MPDRRDMNAARVVGQDGLRHRRLHETQRAGGLVEVAPGTAAAGAFLGNMVDIGLEALAILRLILEDDALDLAGEMRAREAAGIEERRLERRGVQHVDGLRSRHYRVGTRQADALACAA